MGQLFYALCLPACQEAEFAGFFVYCTVILTWLPSFIYSRVVENGYHERYGLGSLCALQMPSFFTIAMVPDWNEVIEGSKTELVNTEETADVTTEAVGRQSSSTDDAKIQEASAVEDFTKGNNENENNISA